MSVKLETRTIGKTKVDIKVTSHGEFEAEIDGNEYRAPTLLALIPILTKAEKRSRMDAAVPVTILGIVPHKPKAKWDTEMFDDGTGAIHANLRAEHTREHNTWLYSTTDGKRFKRGGYGSHGKREVTCRRLTKAEIDLYLTRATNLAKAQQAYDDLIEEYAINKSDALAEYHKRTEKD